MQARAASGAQPSLARGWLTQVWVRGGPGKQRLPLPLRLRSRKLLKLPGRLAGLVEVRAARLVQR